MINRILIGLLAVGSLSAQDVFESRVRPILVASCQPCHNPKIKTAQLDLTTAEGFASGGQSGPLISSEQPAGRFAHERCRRRSGPGCAGFHPVGKDSNSGFSLPVGGIFTRSS